MKVSKIFGCVLGLHVCIIAVLIVQPGCQTPQAPTQTYTQDRSMPSPVEGSFRSNSGMIEATRSSGADSLDAAFNAGFEDDRFEPKNDFSEFDTVAAPIEPIAPLDGMSTITVEGSSFETYTIKKGDSLWSLSRRYGVSLSDIYAANGLDKNSVLKIGQQIKIPVEGGSAQIQAVTADDYQPSGFNMESASYTVSRGDNLTKIANRFNTTINAIKAANGKSNDSIRVGEVLLIPMGDDVPAPVPTRAAAAPSEPSNFSGEHIVRAGEFPATIAKKYGMTTSELLSVNGITDPRRMQIGQRLIVSSTGTPNNVDSQTQAVVVSSSSAPSSSNEPVEITVIEADPLVDGELQAVEVISETPPPASEPTPSEDGEVDLFDNAVEIPVIRLEE